MLPGNRGLSVFPFASCAYFLLTCLLLVPCLICVHVCALCPFFFLYYPLSGGPRPHVHQVYVGMRCEIGLLDPVTNSE
jgi:hypothetical protein